MSKIEDWRFIQYEDGEKIVMGVVYDDHRFNSSTTEFQDGHNIRTSVVKEECPDLTWVKTKNTLYELGKHSEYPDVIKDNNYYLLRKGAPAIHKLGNIGRDVLDAEVIVIDREEDNFLIGQFAQGFGFINVKFNKFDCRKPTQEELVLICNGKIEEIKY